MEMNNCKPLRFLIGSCLLIGGILSVSAQTFVPKASYLGQWAFAPGVAHQPSQSIYLMGTYQFGDIDQFIKYDVTNNSWSTIPGVPPIKSEFGFAFGVSNRIFFGGGVDQPGTFSNATYEFIPPNIFNVVDNIPNGPASAFNFVVGNYAYVGGGMVTGFVNLNSMFRFDPTGAAGTQWSAVSSYPGSGKLNCSAGSLNGFGYAGLGRSNPGSTEYNDFWRYDPNTGAGGTWTAMSPFPGIARECAILTPICGKLILMGGVTQTGMNFNDIWQFDPAAGPSGAWTYLGTNNGVYGPQNGRYGPAYASYGDSLFLGMGYGVAGANNDWKMFTYCPVVPLPIELVNFNVQLNQEYGVDILWTTASEINNHHFEVLRSVDAIHWETIEQIEGAGNSSSLLEYQVIDRFPMQGINYYKIKQVDYNGDFTFSEMASIEILENFPEDPTVYPNPVEQNLEVIIQYLTEGMSYTILNCYGSEVLNGKINDGQTTIPTQSLAPGIYYLRIRDSKESTFKIIKL